MTSKIANRPFDRGRRVEWVSYEYCRKILIRGVDRKKNIALLLINMCEIHVYYKHMNDNDH